jgi:beta-lactamase superfamily II metal-dependent hydrolase
MTSIARLLAKFAIGACAVAGVASQAAAAPPEGMKLYTFTSYPLDIAKSALSSAATGDEKIIVPVGFFLIKHPKGNIMFDTGDNDRLVSDKTYWGPMAAMLDKGVDPNLTIDAQLGKIGMKASDINYVILGHMHLDHAGNASRFPNATIVVQHDEIINAFWPPKSFAGAIGWQATDDRTQRRSRFVRRRQRLHSSLRRPHSRKPDGGYPSAQIRHHHTDQRCLLPAGEPRKGYSAEHRAGL